MRNATMTNTPRRPEFADTATLLSGPTLALFALHSRRSWERAIAKGEMRRRIARGDVNDLPHDAAEALGLT